MEELTKRVEEVWLAIEIMRDLDSKIAEYCPHRDEPIDGVMMQGKPIDVCEHCPIRKKCLDDGHLDIDAEFTIEELADYISYSDTINDIIKWGE